MGRKPLAEIDSARAAALAFATPTLQHASLRRQLTPSPLHAHADGRTLAETFDRGGRMRRLRRARSRGTPKLIAALREAGVYPLSDLDRPPVV